MSIIQASSAGVKDMADGSLRITFEFDPRYAKEAYSLFASAARTFHEQIRKPFVKWRDSADVRRMA